MAPTKDLEPFYNNSMVINSRLLHSLQKLLQISKDIILLERRRFWHVFGHVRSSMNYLWSHQFAICTNHQALITPLSTQGTGICPLCIPHWDARLFNYNFTMQYLKGSDNMVADALSSLPIPDTEGEPPVIEVVSVIAAPLTQVDFQSPIADDPVFPCVIRYMQTSWPEEKHITPELCPYYNVRDNLSLIDDTLFHGKSIVPTHLREQIINIGHETHSGISHTTITVGMLLVAMHQVQGATLHCMSFNRQFHHIFSNTITASWVSQ